jgi:hypothetical protein
MSGVMITWIPYTGYGTVEQRENPPRNESFTQKKLMLKQEISVMSGGVRAVRTA